MVMNFGAGDCCTHRDNSTDAVFLPPHIMVLKNVAATLLPTPGIDKGNAVNKIYLVDYVFLLSNRVFWLFQADLLEMNNLLLL